MKTVLNRVVAVGGLLAVSAGQAFAALPESVATDVSAAKTDIVAAGGLVIGVAVAIAAVRWVKRLF